MSCADISRTADASDVLVSAPDSVAGFIDVGAAGSPCCANLGAISSLNCKTSPVFVSPGNAL